MFSTIKYIEKNDKALLFRKIAPFILCEFIIQSWGNKYQGRPFL